MSQKLMKKKKLFFLFVSSFFGRRGPPPLSLLPRSTSRSSRSKSGGRELKNPGRKDHVEKKKRVS